MTIVAAAFASPVAHARVRNLAFALALIVRRASWSPTRTRCWTATRSATACRSRPRPPARRAASSGSPTPAAGAYYLRTFTWGFGWLPSLFALGGVGGADRAPPAARAAARARRRSCCSSTSATSRASSPAGCCRSTRSCACSRPRAIVALADALAQPRVLAPRARRRWCCCRASCSASTTTSCWPSADTRRSRATGWSQQHPVGTKIVIEPIAPDQWATDAGHPLFGDRRRHRLRQPLEQVRDVALVLLQRQARGRGRRARWSSSRTTSARPRPALVESYEQRRLLLGRHRLDPVRPRVRGPGGGPDALALLRRAASSAATSSSASSPYGDASACRSRSTTRSTTTRSNTTGPGPEIVIYRLHGVRDCERMRARRLAIAAGFWSWPLGVPNLIVWLGGREPVTTDTARGPARPGGAGARRAGDAQRRAELDARRTASTAAAELYEAGRVDKLLLSGDHSRVDYDEVGTMRRILLARGIPARGHLHRPRGLRHVGLRAARPARVRRRARAVVVTQRFHMARALYDARRAGLKVTGFAADRRDYGRVMRAAAGPRGRRARQDAGRRRHRRRPALPRRRDPDHRRWTAVVGGLIRESISSVGT